VASPFASGCGTVSGMQRDVWFGVSLDDVNGNALLARAGRADDDGLDLVTIADHPWIGERPDAYATLGVVLGRTRRVAGAVDVTNLPNRPAPMLARTLAGLSGMAGGRVVLGIGAGGSYPEIARLGLDVQSPAQAVRALAEAITVIQALGGGGAPVTFAGEFYSVRDLAPSPEPVPPIWTGSVGPASLAVTGRLADGWIPGHAADWRSARVATSRPVIDEAAAAAGRDPRSVATVYNLPGRITAAPLPATRDDDGRWIGGSVQQWADELTAAVLAYGAGGFILFPRDDMTVERWSREVVPLVRAAVGQG
jgi:alkanesulfonate monooxygenase SsuD/methylene tetrahydromethanopterin reductase-like flavin-dependent oxidoreductase (luciferase family)